jgi:hypothetical protein
LTNIHGYLEALSDEMITPDPELLVPLHEEDLLLNRIANALHACAGRKSGCLVWPGVLCGGSVLVEESSEALSVLDALWWDREADQCRVVIGCAELDAVALVVAAGCRGDGRRCRARLAGEVGR